MSEFIVILFGLAIFAGAMYLIKQNVSEPARWWLMGGVGILLIMFLYKAITSLVGPVGP